MDSSDTNSLTLSDYLDFDSSSINNSFDISDLEPMNLDEIKNIGKKYYSVRGKKLEKILKEIDKETFFKATLGGCIVKKVKQTIIISKE